MMSSRQKVVQMQHYWNDLSHTATDDMKKKSMKMRFGITNIKLDKKGGKLISFDESMDWTKFDTPFGDRHTKKFDSWDEWEKVEKEREKLQIVIPMNRYLAIAVLIMGFLSTVIHS